MDSSAHSGLEWLDDDIMGELLPMLDDANVQNALLCCKGWRTALRRQIRALKPAYLPDTPPDAYNSLEQLQLRLVRPVPADVPTAAAMPTPLTSLAPLRSISCLDRFCHSSHVDLSGQKLPDDTVKLLSLHMQQLKTLVLDSCILVPAALLYATGLTTLQHLSLARLQLIPPTLFHHPDTQAEKLAVAGNHTAAIQQLITKAEAEQARVQSNYRTLAGGVLVTSDNRTTAQRLADAWISREQQHDVQLKMLRQRQCGVVFTSNSTQQLDMEAAERGLVLDAVLLPQLQQLNLDRRPRAFSSLNSPSPWTLLPANAPTGLGVQGHLSKLARLTCLSSLGLAGNRFDAQGWQAMYKAVASRLTELRMHWDGFDAALDAEAFAHISKFTRLQSLSLTMHNIANQSVLAQYSLAPLSSTLTSLQLHSEWPNVELLMSITTCSKVARLELSGLTEPFRGEFIIHVARSMPLLKSLAVYRLRSLDRHGELQYILLQPGDALLSQLDHCCPHLTQLLIPDLPLDGRGLKQAVSCLSGMPPVPGHSTAIPEAQWIQESAVADAEAAAAAAAGGGGGGLHSLQKLELCATQLMRATLQHLSCLTSLRSLTLHAVPLRDFPQACRLNCFGALSALQHLTSLRILPIPAEQKRFAHLPPYVPGQTHAALQLQQQMQQMLGAHQQLLQQVIEPGGAPPGQEDMDDEAMQMIPHNIHQAMQNAADMEMLLPEGVPDAAAVLDAAADVAVAAAAGVGGGGPPAVAEDQQGMHAAAAAAAAAAVAEDAAMEVDGDDVPSSGAEDAESDEWETGSEGDWEDDDDGVSSEEGGSSEDDEDQQHQVHPQQQQQHLPFLNGNNAMDVGEAAPLLPQQAQVALQPWKTRPLFEPHLNFLSELPGLVELELGCLQTSGTCLLHLHKLPHLRSLTLGGNITLSESSLQAISQLKLLGVAQLSLSGCQFVQTPMGSSGGAGSSNPAAAGASSSAAAMSAATFSSSNMDRLASVLVQSFPYVARLELGSCRTLSYAGFETVILGLCKLKMLRLLGVQGLTLDPPGTDELKQQQQQLQGQLQQQQQQQQQPRQLTPSCSSSSRPPQDAPTTQQLEQHCLPYFERIQQRLLLRSATTQLQLKYLEISEGEVPQSGIAAAAGHGLMHFAAQQVKGRSLVFVMQEGKMVQVQL